MPRWIRCAVALTLLLGALVVVIASLGWRPHTEEPSATDETAPPSALVQTSAARRVSHRDTLTAYGTVEFSPEQAQAIDLEAERVITRIAVAAGQTVRQGDVLLTARATPNAELELERARIDVDFAERALARVKDLRARQLATNAQVQAAESDVARTNAVLASTLKRLGGSVAATVRASTDGVVQSVDVKQGDVVAPHTPLLHLARGDDLQVRLGVEPGDLPQVQTGQAVLLTPLQGSPTPVHSAITRIYRQVDPQRRLAQVVVPVPAASPLLPGAVIRGDIVVAERSNVLTVPRSAVLSEGGRPYVFVVEHGHASRRWVETGKDDGQDVEIVRGVRTGDSVVTVGNYELKDGMAVRLGKTTN